MADENKIYEEDEVQSPYKPLPEFECKVCDKKFFNSRALCGHMRAHRERNWRGLVPPPQEASNSPSLGNIGGNNNPDPVRNNLGENIPQQFKLGSGPFRIMNGQLTIVAEVGMPGGSGGSNLGTRPALPSEDPLGLLPVGFKRARGVSLPDLNEDFQTDEGDAVEGGDSTSN